MKSLLVLMMTLAVFTHDATAAEPDVDALAIAAPITPDIKDIQTNAASVSNAAPASHDVKPVPTMRQGMKFIPLDRKKMIGRPLSKNQPAIIRPRSKVMSRNVKSPAGERKSPIRIGDDSASTTSSHGDPVLSVFEPASDVQ